MYRKIGYFLKWSGIVNTVLAILNFLGVTLLLLIGDGWSLIAFLHMFLESLMLEGLLFALVGCLSFFGLEKYRELFSRSSNCKEHQEKTQNTTENEPKLRLGPFLVAEGILLFAVSF
ncbi:MAG: hypothetical protein ACETVN_00005, partial [Asgard group archaeon]